MMHKFWFKEMLKSKHRSEIISTIKVLFPSLETGKRPKKSQFLDFKNHNKYAFNCGKCKIDDHKS